MQTSKIIFASSNLNNQLVPPLLNLRLLIVDDVYEKLVFKSFESHSEVNDGELDASFRQEVRIVQLGREHQSEVGVVDQWLVTKVQFLDSFLCID